MDEKALHDSPALAVWWHLARTFSLVARDCDRVLSRWGVTGPQFGVLSCIEAAGGSLPLSQIGDRMLVTCSNITGVVDRLERDGLVIRERPGGDRRVILAQITDAGRQLVHEAHDALVCHVTGLLQFMGPEECQGLAQQLERIHRHLREGPSS